MADKTRRLTTHPEQDLLHKGDVFFLPSIERLKEWEDKSLGAPVAYLLAGFHEAYMQVLTLKPGEKAESRLVLPKDIPSPGEFIRLLTLRHFSPALRRETLDTITAMLSTHVPNLQAAVQSGWQVLENLPDSLQAFKDTDSRLAWINLGRDGLLNAGFSLTPKGSEPTTRTDINWIQGTSAVPGTPNQPVRFATFAEAEAACAAVMANTQAFPLRSA